MTKRQPALARMADMPGEKNSKTIAPAMALPASTSPLIALGLIASPLEARGGRSRHPRLASIVDRFGRHGGAWATRPRMRCAHRGGRATWVFPGWRAACAGHHNRLAP